MNQKASDYSTIPLCARHHRTGNDSLHKLGPRKFEHKFGLDLIGIAERLAQFPTIRIESGVFAAYLEGERYLCGPVSMGPAKARDLAIEYFKTWRREQLMDLRRRDFGEELRFPRRQDMGVTERIGS